MNQAQKTELAAMFEEVIGNRERSDKALEHSWGEYRRKGISEMRPYLKGEKLNSIVSISQADKENGSPKIGDMIARNPQNHNDQWLVAKDYFKANFEKVR